MKIIFLDIDGVLNSKRYKRRSLEESEMYRHIDQSKVLLFKEIVDRTGAQIVLSSSWKIMLNDHLNPTELASFYFLEILKQHGLRLLDKTESIGDQRGEEIRKWLSDHPEVCAYVILDDNRFDWADLRRYWVKTGYNKGLTKQGVEKAVKILNRRSALCVSS